MGKADRPQAGEIIVKRTTKAQLLDELKKSPIIQVVCQKAGVARSTYYRWRAEDPAFAEAADQALTESTALMNDVAESQLISAIKEKNLTAIIFWLKNRHSAYATRVEISGHLKHENEALTPEQETIVQEALRLAGLQNLPEVKS